ncbi:MAG: hypothetical protein LBU32_09670 [Clostridiales bacterium]|jgi:hypothetical protein|nr:hypothetical protein [Clostridiales bacterium]
MNIYNFEDYVDDVILERGWDYFKKGRVLSIENIDGEWVAEISGKGGDYSVSVTVSASGDIESSCCDCPYDWGGHCKHEVAVFYSLREENLFATQKGSDLEEGLSKLDKSELLQILIQKASVDRKFKSHLKKYLETHIDLVKTERNNLRRTISMYAEKGFQCYEDMEEAVKGADKALEDLRAKGYSRQRLIQIYIGSVEELMDMMGLIDDSTGYISGVAEKAIESLSAIAEQDELSHDDFELIFNFSKQSIFDNWSEWRFEIIDSLLPMCSNPSIRMEIVSYLRQIMNGEAERALKYDKEKAEEAEHRIIKTFDGDDEAEEYVNNHLSNSDFREMAIDSAIKRGQLDRALKLCVDGEQLDKDLAGLVLKWKKSRYEVYEKQGDIENQKKLAFEFVRENEYEYFVKLKNLYSTEDWPDMRRRVVELSDLRTSLLERIVVSEGMKDKILEMCKRNIPSIMSLHNHLIPDYELEVEGLFLKFITSQAHLATSVDQYRTVCAALELYGKDCGYDKARMFRNILAETFKGKADFREELIKAKLG